MNEPEELLKEAEEYMRLFKVKFGKVLIEYEDDKFDTMLDGLIRDNII